MVVRGMERKWFMDTRVKVEEVEKICSTLFHLKMKLRKTKENANFQKTTNILLKTACYL